MRVLKAGPHADLVNGEVLKESCCRMHDKAKILESISERIGVGLPAGHVKLPEERKPQVHMGEMVGVLTAPYC